MVEINEKYMKRCYLGEEDGQDVFTSKMSKGLCFVIDPIDGTCSLDWRSCSERYLWCYYLPF